MSRTIITQEDIDAAKERERKKRLELYRIYRSHSDVRDLADHIHQSRMGAQVPACPQCIEMAISQLESKKQ